MGCTIILLYISPQNDIISKNTKFKDIDTLSMEVDYDSKRCIRSAKYNI